MRRRVLLVLVLAALMDLGNPLVPETPEALERFDEAAHGRRRVSGPVHGVSAEPVAARRAAVTTTAVQRPTRRGPWARRTPAAPPPRGKLTPALSDPASSPDAH
jgi:hypothetical protein